MNRCERIVDPRLLQMMCMPLLAVGYHFNEWTNVVVAPMLYTEFDLTDLWDRLPRTRACPSLLPQRSLAHVHFNDQLRI
jgi:hypothetical protein